MYRALHNTLALKMREEQRRETMTSVIAKILVDLKEKGNPLYQGLDVECVGMAGIATQHGCGFLRQMITIRNITGADEGKAVLLRLLIRRDSASLPLPVLEET